METRGGGSAVAALVAILLAAAMVPVAACRREESPPPAATGPVQREPLVIALLPEQNVFLQKEYYQPLGKYLSRRVDREVSFKLLNSYGSIFREIEERKVHGAFFGSLNYVLANRQLGVKVLARPLWVNGESTYTGLIFIRRGGAVGTDVRTWKGKVLALVSKFTTAGYVYPVAYLKRFGVDDLETYFSHVSYTGSHDAAIMAVLNGDADVGAAKNTIFQRMAARDPTLRDKLVIVAESKEVPSNGLGVRPDLPEELVQRLAEALSGMDEDQEGKKVLEHLGAVKFLPTALGDYDPVVVMASEAGLDLNRYPVSQDYTQFSSPVPPGGKPSR
jgi:phosphonate transport system substrate-binding protein